VHARAHAHLVYGLAQREGFVIVTGEVGAGKTTLIRKLLAEMDEREVVALVSHTHANLKSVLPMVLDAFGVHTRAVEDESGRYRDFVQFLIDRYAGGKRCVLIIDEAQNLSLAALEQLRLLSNVNADDNLLLQTILVGQPELRAKLRRPELRQFAQRISVDFFLPTLSHDEAILYIEHRLVTAGGPPELFTDSAKQLIATATNGLPRLINNLADMALVYAFGEGKTAVDEAIVRDVLADKEQSGILPLAMGPASAQSAIIGAR
jgi:type II secretory pathway predicted ATPase ExeA